MSRGSRTGVWDLWAGVVCVLCVLGGGWLVLCRFWQSCLSVAGCLPAEGCLAQCVARCRRGSSPLYTSLSEADHVSVPLRWRDIEFADYSDPDADLQASVAKLSAADLECVVDLAP
jgi:hypothetical protein